MTLVAGQHLDGYLSSRPGQDQRKCNGQLLWDFGHRQIAADSCSLYADLHPGTFLFRTDGRLGIVDFGCVKSKPCKCGP